ncbi:MAG: hypothetical protein GX825_04230 [Syntrophomonadaceae bacterium]|nr:hypothetical protein [Syntrophomonadaceae bacterium]
MANYIDQTYDYDKIEKIYLSGDGAGCIKTGTGVINKSTLQAVRVARAHIENGERELWRVIR